MKDARKKSIHLTAAASFKFVLFVVCSGGLAASGSAVAGGRGTPLPPAIIKTAIDVKANVLIISGRRFGEARPTVTLSDQELEVKRFSDREVVAGLPPDLKAATYGVTVIATGRNRASSNLFSTTLP